MKTLRHTLLFILCVVATTYAYAQSPDNKATAPQTYSCVINGLERTYRLYIPDNLPAKAPLVFVLHGYGGSFNLDHYGMNAVAEKNGFAVCYPQGIKDSRGKTCWNVGYPFQADMTVDDVSFLCKLAAKLQKEHNLSRLNTFCTGMSNGGEMCYLLAYCNQTTFAATAPIAGLTMAWMPERYKHSRPIPLMEVHGTEDRTSEWTGDPDNKGGWGAYLAVPDAVDYWVRCARCTDAQTVSIPVKAGGTAQSVTLHRYGSGRHNIEVWLYEIKGGGHSWGNKDIDTSEEIWKFFCKFVR